ncbi:hypothetical protein [Bradyrhizobium sp.]|uniref:hypothetical protein n=1 Tax=Bradyrhizobium sp. TaxID=376 RepID=UPI003C5D063F
MPFAASAEAIAIGQNAGMLVIDNSAGWTAVFDIHDPLCMTLVRFDLPAVPIDALRQVKPIKKHEPRNANVMMTKSPFRSNLTRSLDLDQRLFRFLISSYCRIAAESAAEESSS